MNLQKQINELTKGCGDEIYKDIGGFPNCCGDDDGEEIYLCQSCKSKSQGLLIGLRELKKAVDDEIEFVEALCVGNMAEELILGQGENMRKNIFEPRLKNLTKKSEKLSKQIKELEKING